MLICSRLADKHGAAVYMHDMAGEEAFFQIPCSSMRKRCLLKIKFPVHNPPEAVPAVALLTAEYVEDQSDCVASFESLSDRNPTMDEAIGGWNSQQRQLCLFTAVEKAYVGCRFKIMTSNDFTNAQQHESWTHVEAALEAKTVPESHHHYVRTLFIYSPFSVLS